MLRKVSRCICCVAIIVMAVVACCAEEAVSEWFSYISANVNENGTCEIAPLGRADNEDYYSISYDLGDDHCQVNARFILRNNGVFMPKSLNAAIFKYIIPQDPNNNIAFADAAGRIPIIAVFKENMPESDYELELEKIESKIVECVSKDEITDKYEYVFPSGAKLWIYKDVYLPGEKNIYCMTVSVWYQ